MSGNKIFVKDKMAPKKNFADKYRNIKNDPLFSQTTINRQQVLRRFVARSLRPINIQYTYSLRVYNRNTKKEYTIKKQTFKYKGRIGGFERARRKWERDTEEFYRESNIEVLSMNGRRSRLINLEMAEVLGLFAGHLNSLDIDGYIPAKTFQVNQNECVMDFLMKTYQHYFKHRKLDRCDLYRTLNENECETMIGNLGVNTYQILTLCKEYGIPLRAIDDNRNFICKYDPPKRARYFKNKKHHNIPPLYYMIKNNHMYPLEHSTIKQLQGTSIRKDKKETKKEKQIEYECLPNDDTCSYDWLIDKMKQLNKEPKYIRTAKLGHIKFRIDNKVFLPHTKEDIQPFMDYCKKYDIEYIGQSSYSTFNQQFIDLPIKSSMNNQVSTIFNTYKRGQVHIGRTTDKISKDDIINKKVVDLTKCHRQILLNPNNDWFRLTPIDTFEEFLTEDYDHENGFYFVQTKDTDLFSGDGLYTNKIIDVAIKNRIKYTLRAICRPSYTINKDIFKKPIEKFLKGDDSKSITHLKKMVINTIAGSLGTDSIKSQFLKVNKNINQVSNNLYELESKNPEKRLIIHKVQDYFIYGNETKTPIINNNRPLYLQIIEQANIKLYELQQKILKAKGKILFRYSDEIHYVGEYIKTDETFDYKQTNLENILNFELEIPIEYKTHTLYRQIEKVSIDWNKQPETDSDDYAIIVDKLIKKGGLIEGMGGTGKSHIIKHLIEAIETREETYYALAYTNDAALNIGGKTFHSTFNLKPEANEIPNGYIKNRTMPNYIIVDEVSMVNTFIYSILDQIKLFHPETKIVLCGDFHQIQPIGEEHLNFKESYILKQLANEQQWFLKKNHRTDNKKLVCVLKALTKMGQNINGKDFNEYTLTHLLKENLIKSDNLTDMVYGWNIGYNNLKSKYGKRINDKLNNHHATIEPDKLLDISGCPFKVIRGMRVVCKGASKLHLCAKNEILEVIGTHYNEEDNKRTIVLLNKITGRDLPRHFIEYDLFIKSFDAGYLITADKSQCKTLKGKVFIHQLNKLFKGGYNRLYVALGRATTFDNIYLTDI